jgi:hypothetical protein
MSTPHTFKVGDRVTYTPAWESATRRDAVGTVVAVLDKGRVQVEWDPLPPETLIKTYAATQLTRVEP